VSQRVAAEEAERTAAREATVDERTAPDDERRLLERVQAGEAGAFDELVRRYLRPAYAIAYRVLKQREDAEDVAQEALVATLETIHRFDTRRPFGPWLYRIVMNRALNARKSRSIRAAEPVAEDVVSPGESPEQASERSEARDRLDRALATLPERQALIVRLFELEGFSSAEIGSMLQLSDGTVRWHLHQARGALREALRTYRTGT
jgi:RNA polymerase sigma-70 factor (ECF subfamily)